MYGICHTVTRIKNVYAIKYTYGIEHKDGCKILGDVIWIDNCLECNEVVFPMLLSYTSICKTELFARDSDSEEAR